MLTITLTHYTRTPEMPEHYYLEGRVDGHLFEAQRADTVAEAQTIVGDLIAYAEWLSDSEGVVAHA